MKKIILILGVFLVTFGIVGCSFGTMTDVPTTITTSTTQTSNTAETTLTTLDEDMIVSEVYNLIYEDLYEEVKPKL